MPKTTGQKTDLRLPGPGHRGGLITKGCERTFRGDGTVPCLDYGDGYMVYALA